MGTISRRAQLDQDIEMLKVKQYNDLEALKYQFRTVQESLNPLNLIKNTIRDVASNTTASGLLGGAVSIAGDYLSDKILPGKGPLKKIGTSILRFFGNKFFSKG